MDDKSRTRYKRLPGRGPRKRGFTVISRSRCSLYMGDDHLLAVDNHGFSEDYKRFYFSDIQAIITRKTKRGAIWNIILACTAVCCLIAALFLQNEPLRIFFWGLSGVFFVFLLINLLRGPTCICHIITAVQEDLLPSLNRLRTARKTIGVLRQAIDNIQGKLTPEEIITRSKEVTNNRPPPMNNTRQSPDKQKPVRHYNGTAHMIGFAIMLADGIAISIDLLHHTKLIIAASILLTVIYCIFIIIALVKQYESDIPGVLRKITWASIVFICISYVLGFIMTMGLIVARKPEVMMTQWDMYRAMLDLSPQDSLFLMAVYGISAACSLILGVLGLMRAINHRSASAVMSPPDPNPAGDPEA